MEDVQVDLAKVRKYIPGRKMVGLRCRQ
jgi:hypothetical protein